MSDYRVIVDEADEHVARAWIERLDNGVWAKVKSMAGHTDDPEGFYAGITDGLMFGAGLELEFCPIYLRLPGGELKKHQLSQI